MSGYISLSHRSLIAISGEDRRSFLQGLVSADVEKASSPRYGAFLTPQGKYLYDFFLAELDSTLLLEVEAAGRDDFIRRLSRFRLRSKVTLAPKDDWRVYAILGEGEVNGVDWQKGCFMGQEVTARSKYRGQIKKRLLPVEIEGAAPEPGTILTLDGLEAGEMRSHLGRTGLAVIRLDSLDRGPLVAGETRLTPKVPAWVKI
jgi:folate-binding Fe-S cluster repair protein YgfZ